MPYDILTDPTASNYLATLAQQAPAPAPAPVAPQQAPVAAPVPRQSLWESLSRLGDVISMSQGHEGLYQASLDDRQNRDFAVRKAQMGLQSDQNELDDAATKRLMMAAPALEEAFTQGGPQAAQAAWPQIAQMAGITDPAKVAQFGQMLQTDTPGTLRQIKAMIPKQAQGSLPKELQIYELLKQRDPAKAEAYLQALSEGGVMTPYQEEQINVRREGIGVQREGIRARTAVQREAIRQRQIAAAARGAGGKGAAGAVMKMPAAVQQAYLSNQDAIRQIDAAKKAVEARPESVGAKFAILPDIAAQRLDREGQKARIGISNIGSLIIHERTGATMAKAEAARLKPFIPNVSDTPENIGNKLDALRKIAEDNNRSIEEYYKQSPAAPAGSRPRGNVSSPPAGAISMLRQNPSLRAQFDAKYGAGAAAKVLGR